MHIEAEIECGVCTLRALGMEDVPALAQYANNPKVAVYLRDRFPRPYSTEDARRFVEYADSTQDECVAGIVVEGEVVGVVGLQFCSDIERCSAEIGYWLGEPFWGRGIAGVAIQAFTNWAMPRFALTRVYAEVFADNRASARVLEKAGFEYVGLLRKAAIKNGVHHDYCLYDLVR